MAAVTSLGATFLTASGTETVTATPAVGDLIVIITACSGSTAAIAPTDNNGTGTYVLVNSCVKATSADIMNVWVRTALIASATSTIFTSAPGTTTGGGLFVLKVTGMTRVGGNAIRQSAIQSNQAAAGTPAPVLPSIPLSANPIIGAVFNATSPATMTPRASYTEFSDLGYSTPTTGCEDMAINSGETSATITWGGTSASAFCSIAVELDSGIDATPARVQAVCGPSAMGPINSYKLQLPNASLSGNCIVVGVTCGGSNTITVTDDQSNTYTAGPSVLGNQFCKFFFAPGAAAGVKAITVSFSAGQQFVQVVALEYRNVSTAAYLDGSSTGSGTAAACATGAIATTGASDLLLQVAWSDTGAACTGWTQGTSPWKLIFADIASQIVGGCAVQDQVQVAAGSITPSVTQAPGTNHFDTLAIALKSAAAGTAPAAGIRVQSVYHAQIPGTASSPIALQFPCTGNLLVAAILMIDAFPCTAVADGNSNTWTFAGANLSNAGSGNLRFAYAVNPTTGTTMTGPTLTCTGTNASGDTVVLFDIVGADTSAPFDSTAGNPTATGTDSTAGSHSVNTVSITPSVANSLVLSMMGLTNPEPANALTPGNLISCTSSPEASSGDMDENNGWALEYNTTTSSRTYAYTMPAGAAGNWAAMAVTFKAPAPPTPMPPLLGPRMDVLLRM